MGCTNLVTFADGGVLGVTMNRPGFNEIIHYNCIGSIEIPDILPLPAPEVSVNTRKGVIVNYILNSLKNYPIRT